MLVNVSDDVAQVRLWVEPVKFGGADQTVDRRRALATGVGSGEQEIFAFM